MFLLGTQSSTCCPCGLKACFPKLIAQDSPLQTLDLCINLCLESCQLTVHFERACPRNPPSASKRFFELHQRYQWKWKFHLFPQFFTEFGSFWIRPFPLGFPVSFQLTSKQRSDFRLKSLWKEQKWQFLHSQGVWISNYRKHNLPHSQDAWFFLESLLPRFIRSNIHIFIHLQDQFYPQVTWPFFLPS